ncbi:hypothetical protein IMCC3317_06470 [Kordia antarctica]|uniref:FG-GAP repeat protein n=1 Tax=Kordia antarctica TaxID=1218801 RepID=A0A7L4ZFT7_9FLAO|nr:T9SS type B sorting domain-containing protein [Kordia antarctica]QHI35301.1 hypothetical protein IMCC3317_06470 [Kordia antarctica]
MQKACFLIATILYSCCCFSQNYSVSSSQKINELTGNFAGNLDVSDNFAISIDAIGDLDGNGVNDLAVGAYTDDDGGTDRGAVWILFLDADNLVISHTKISDTSGNFTGILDNDDRFGGAVAYLGDLNNDGLIELAVGADYDGDGGFWHGAVWILSLNPDGTVNSHSKISDTQGGFTGFFNGDVIFGTDIENIGDINNDGIEDLAVGSRRDGDGGARRGAVWILFMNANFTVNNFQKISDTQGNFTGILEFEDYFGGSVASVGDLDEDGTTDIVVGAYRDDDQISNSGSFYVLFLNPDGTVKNHQKVSNLSGGFNGTISNNALFGESIDGVIDIDNDGKIEIVVGALRQQNPTLSSQTGAIYLIELNNDGTVSEEYIYTYGENCFTGTLNSGDFFGGSVTILNDAGTYRFAVGAYKDSENGNDKGAVWILELGEISYVIAATQNPTDCTATDGEIVIADLNSNTIYEITYEFESNVITTNISSDGNGELSISGLSGGNYTNITVNNTVGLCFDNLGDATLNSDSLDVNFTTQSPTICGNPDGSISLSNLASNTTYQISYEFNTNPETITLTSTATGEIVLSNIFGGTYVSFTVLDVNSNCEDILGDILLDQPTINLIFTTTATSSCNTPDGSILIAGLAPNQNYVVDYFNESNQVVNTYNASADGEILLTGLSAGIYEIIMVTDSLNPCASGIGELIIDNLALILTPTTTNPSACGVSDGIISFQGATANTAYTISYSLNGSMETTIVTSDASGILEMNNLGTGIYESIIVEDTITNCIANIGNLTLTNSDLVLTPTTTNPSACGVSDGIISFQGATANTAYTISYSLNGSMETTIVTSDASGILEMNNLGAGMYESIVVEDTITNCIANIGNLTLTNSDLVLTPTTTNPSACGVSDGIISFQGATANTAYTISYSLNGSMETTIVTSDVSGILEMNNLGAGMYESIVVEDTITNCIANIGNLTLTNSDLVLIPTTTNPSACGVSDGIISFQGATANTAYTISYSLNGSMETTIVTSDASGILEMNNLSVGIYTNITIEENSSGCTIVFPFIELICEVETEPCFRIRKFFTPNSDGFNDTWQLEQVQNCNYFVYIYDRYGKIITILTPNYPQWNGTYNGRKMPSGDYWVSIQYTMDAQKQELITNITLKR